ncbi:site-specific DNA-methyltransferase [Rhodococcus sp. USK13]|uniref:site-specific DNA-methyltransferase n=1 Tax=Rhodococcus sp. USK13 TaxID=2806442 RepID=UPI001BCD9755|nr:site-specific DNA-methyltransferase [Rhodococcus sp. USK13]
MEKLRTPDSSDANIDKLSTLFPSVVSESLDTDGNPRKVIDFDLLRQELSDYVVEGPQERYRLDWPGKRAAAFAANAPIAKTFRPVREESVDFDITKNLFIEGDNLDALKLLQESYLGKVKLIYIDPPYNTGGDFIYDDDFVEQMDAYLERSGQTDNRGTKLVANTEANGRFHSDWLSMLYPRLRLARNLLSTEGAIFVSIDDHEMPRLRAIMDEIFGAYNFVATVIWHKVHTVKNTARHFSEDHEYVVIYARNADEWSPRRLPRTEEQDQRFTNPDNDPRGPWISGPIQARNYYSRGLYAITTPSGRVIDGPPSGTYWRYSEVKLAELDSDGRIYWGAAGSNVPRIKRFLCEMEDGRVPQTYWPHAEVGHNQDAKKELLSRVHFGDGDAIFDTPKPTKLIRRMLALATSAESDDIVMDFFAGSATTADAVLQQNAEDGGRRRFVLVQLPEPEGEKSRNIADIARERIRSAGRSVVHETGMSGAHVDVGFRVLRVDATSMADVLRSPDETDQLALDQLEGSVKPDRSGEDLLFQVLLDWGLELTMPINIDQIDGHEVFVVEDGALIACFDEQISPELVRTIAKREPLRAVFRDSGFPSDDARINTEQVFREISPATDVKAI